MKLSSQFDLPAAPDKVVALFFDPATMRACLPGCEELEQIDDKTFRGVLTNEVAHVKFRAGFTAEITSVEDDEATGASVVNAVLKGEDRRLGSTIKVDARMTISANGDDSRVTYELEIAMWGKLGRLGESVIRRRSVEVERQFSEALAAVCAGKPIPYKQEASKAARKAQTSPRESTQAAESEPSAVMPTPVSDRRSDLPFLVALVAAALAWGIILGSRKRAA